MTVTVADGPLEDSHLYNWCVISDVGYTYYQTEDLSAYQTAMATLGLAVDSSGNIETPSASTENTTTDSTTSVS